MNFMMVKTVSINILYFFENDLQKTRVTKSVIFKENAETRFCLNMEVERKETKTKVYKNSNIISIQHKTVNTFISFVVAADFLFLNHSSSLIVKSFIAESEFSQQALIMYVHTSILNSFIDNFLKNYYNQKNDLYFIKNIKI